MSDQIVAPRTRDLAELALSLATAHLLRAAHDAGELRVPIGTIVTASALDQVHSLFGSNRGCPVTRRNQDFGPRNAK